MGKIIVIEGTDCSGKATQAKKLREKLENMGYSVWQTSYPDYDTPTGKIIGGPYLGKEEICAGWFPEKAGNVDAKVASMYYAIDRYYNKNKVEKNKKSHDYVLLDRYTYSNMAHQGGKIKDKKERMALFESLEKLEFEMLHLSVPDIKIFLHMPYQAETFLRQNRKEEKLDEHEQDEKHLQNAEKTYLEIAEKYHFYTIKCTKKENIENIKDIKSVEEISEEIINYVKSFSKEKEN